MKRYAVIAAALLVAGATGRTARASDLYGSRLSMEKQHSVAVDLDYDFAMTPSQIAEVVANGELDRVESNADFEMSGVSFPYAQPAVRQFIERLASEYHAATGQLLVVTSLTRPVSMQPANASPLSVHPAGMAVDLRIPTPRAARSWLSHRLLELEEGGILDVTLERHPAHLHVAVFPEAFESFFAKQDSLAARKSVRQPVKIMATDVIEPAKTVNRASADWLFAALTGGMLLSLIAAFRRRSAEAFAQLRIKRR
jgi:hypothetical protein